MADPICNGFSISRHLCSDLSPEQESIISAVEEIDASLRVSNFHPNGVDFVTFSIDHPFTDANDKKLYHAFAALWDSDFGVGLGIQNGPVSNGSQVADYHLHVDSNGKFDSNGKRRIWIETDKKLNAPSWGFFSRADWPLYRHLARFDYRVPVNEPDVLPGKGLFDLTLPVAFAAGLYGYISTSNLLKTSLYVLAGGIAGKYASKAVRFVRGR